MRNNIKLAALLMGLLMTAALGATTLTWADEGGAPTPSVSGTPGPGEGKGGHGGKFVQTLGLTPEQAQQVKAIMQDSMTQRKAVMEEARQKMEAIDNGLASKMKGVLTPDQFAKFQTMHQQRREKMKEHMKSGGRKQGGEGGAGGNGGNGNQP